MVLKIDRVVGGATGQRPPLRGPPPQDTHPLTPLPRPSRPGSTHRGARLTAQDGVKIVGFLVLGAENLIHLGGDSRRWD